MGVMMAVLAGGTNILNAYKEYVHEEKDGRMWGIGSFIIFCIATFVDVVQMLAVYVKAQKCKSVFFPHKPVVPPSCAFVHFLYMKKVDLWHALGIILYHINVHFL